MKRIISFILFVLSMNLCAQNSVQWEDPYIKPDASGFAELAKGYESQQEGKINVAISWFEKAHKKGNLNAVQSLGYIYATNPYVLDYKKAIEWFSFGVNSNYPPCMFALAHIYQRGNGVVKNFELAYSLYKKGAELGHKESEFKLAECYLLGLGVERNTNQGIKLLEEKGNNGDVNSQMTLGNWFSKFSEPRNYELAKKWFEMAANRGDAYGYMSLARLYELGLGVAEDYDKALRLANQAETALKIKQLPADEEREGKAIILSLKGNIYRLKNDDNKATALWKQLKNNYPEFVERFKYDDGNDFVRIMYNQEENQQKGELSSLKVEKIPSIAVSEVDLQIPENEVNDNPTFAVIIANENYKDVEAVPYAIHDGETFKQYCEKTLGIPQSNIKYVADATLNNIRREINWLSQVMEVYQGEANIILYYAGHGIPNESNGSAYLLPVDGVGNDVTTGYSLDKLYSDLSSKPAKSVVVLLDACFSGAKREGGMLASARGVAIKAKQNAPKGNMIVLSAAQGDETAYPYKEKGHGMFTYYLLKKLQETKGDVSFGELADYVTEEVKKQSVVTNGKMQTPLVTPSNNVINWRNWKLR